MTEPTGVEQRCYNHPEREAYISCQRCERPICPQCMREASVGFQCPSCVSEGSKSVRQARTVAGGRVSAGAPRVTMALIGLNVVAYVAQLATGDQDGQVWREGVMLSRDAITSDGQLLTGVADGGYWRLLTSAFLHASVLHIALNMLSLYIFGPFVERALGTWRFIAAYLAMALVGSVFVFWLGPTNVPTVGASGAIFGLFGAALVLLLRAGQDVRQLLILLAINALISTQGSISWQAHLGGFVAGLVIAGAVAVAPRGLRRYAVPAAVALLLAASVVGVLVRTSALTG